MIALGPLIPMPSHAQAPWLMDYLSGWSAPPGGLVAGQPAVITREGWFPYDCGRVTGATVVDSGHVEFSLRRIDSCAVDTSRLWSRSFDLGILHPGDHTLHLKRVFNSGQPGDSAIASGTFTFQVDAPNPQPPPPPGTPPDFPSFQARCLTGWYTTSDTGTPSVAG